MQRSTVLSTAASAVLTLFAVSVFAADHREAPRVREDPTADINDIYAFRNPTAPDRLVLAMTVNPFSAPSEAITYAFSADVLYSFRIDDDADGREEHEIHVLFDEATPEGQNFAAIFPNGRVVTGPVTQPTEEPVPNPPVIVEENGLRVFAGPRDDPFFFDIVGFFRFLDGTGTFSGRDGFAGVNVSAIVIEIPVALVNGDDRPLGIWGTTARQSVTIRRAPTRELSRTFVGTRIPLVSDFGRFQQLDRMGNPAVATVLIPAGKKDLFNATRPRFDGDDWAATIVASLTALGTSEANIGVLASVAVPDTLKLDASAPSAFPNGRAPADDVIDVLLGLILNSPGIGDGVDANDRAFESEFPFLAPPQQPL